MDTGPGLRPRHHTDPPSNEPTHYVRLRVAPPIWQLPRLPSAPQYIRATPGESYPSFGNPTSSIAYAFGAMCAAAQQAMRSRTSLQSHVEEETNCCNC